MSIIPALRKLRLEDCKFEASLGYIVRYYLNQSKSKQIKKRKEKEKN
jgi:hypothetical protein